MDHDWNVDAHCEQVTALLIGQLAPSAINCSRRCHRGSLQEAQWTLHSD